MIGIGKKIKEQYKMMKKQKMENEEETQNIVWLCEVSEFCPFTRGLKVKKLMFVRTETEAIVVIPVGDPKTCQTLGAVNIWRPQHHSIIIFVCLTIIQFLLLLLLA